MFSGVIAVVKHPTEDRYRIVVPNTLPSMPLRKALDGTPLRPHFPHVRVGRRLDFLEPGHRIVLDTSLPEQPAVLLAVLEAFGIGE